MRFVGLRLASRCFVLVLLAAPSVVVGCRNVAVGRACDVGTAPPTAAGGSQILTISSPALECPSRICLAGANLAGTAGLCTSSCESDTDCQDAETDHCASGFACIWPTTVGDFACQKLCVCRDVVPEPTGGSQKPAACP